MGKVRQERLERRTPAAGRGGGAGSGAATGVGEVKRAEVERSGSGGAASALLRAGCSGHTPSMQYKASVAIEK